MKIRCAVSCNQNRYTSIKHFRMNRSNPKVTLPLKYVTGQINVQYIMGELEIFCCHSIIFTPTPLHSSYAQETIHLMWSCSAGDSVTVH